MSPDFERLVTAAENGYQEACLPNERLSQRTTQAIVHAVLMELREVSGETEGYREGLWSRRNVEALVRDILAEPATA